MNTISLKKDNKVLMIAHRGVSGLEPENTIPAFVAAGNRSYYGVESDVHVTGDGKFVMIHDENTGRVAGDDICVETSPFDLVRKINLYDICKSERDAKIAASEKGKRADLIIPSLTEYVNVCKKYDKKCVLELKNRFERHQVADLVEEIKGLDYLDNIIFISFCLENLVILRELLPEHTLQFLTWDAGEEVIEKLDQYNLDLDVYYKGLTQASLQEVHARGHKVNVWTCDKVEDAEMLIEWGVDFITTNILE